MKKLQFTKKTISNLKNLDELKGGANDPYRTMACNTQEECTYSAYRNCPATSSRATEGRSRNGGSA